jgi:hypothetical protein
LAQLALGDEDWPAAECEVQLALRLADDLGDRPARAELLRLSALIAHGRGERATGLSRYVESATAYRSAGMPAMEVQALQDGALLAVDAGDRGAAVAFLERLRDVEHAADTDGSVLASVLIAILEEDGHEQLARRLGEAPPDELIDEAIELVGQRPGAC